MAEAVSELPATPSQISDSQSTLTLIQANILVAMLGGFWARRADGHPGPDLMGRGLMLLGVLVEWERVRRGRPRKGSPARDERHMPG
jgi:hypothetical protein